MSKEYDAGIDVRICAFLGCNNTISQYAPANQRFCCTAHEFCAHFGIARVDQLKAKDGDRAEEWLNAKITEAKKNAHHSTDVGSYI